ncbi:MAG: hypothetical protein E6713_07755 [Sporomusaceae bacterium]|nr:hypothetical protein [Sporomusaceae bacterium]
MNANTIIGRGVPSNEAGNNGEYFIDFIKSMIYGPKADGKWGEGVSLTEFDASALDIPLEDIASDQPEVAPTLDSTNDIELTPLQKLEARIAELEADGSEMYTVPILALKYERDKLILISDSKAKAAQVQKVVQEAAEEVEDGAKKAEENVESFWKKNKNDIINYTIIVLLAISAAKSMGVL